MPLCIETAATLHYVTTPDKPRFTLLESTTPSIHMDTARLQLTSLPVAHYLLRLAATSRDNCTCTSQVAVRLIIAPTCSISPGRSECMIACAHVDAQTAELMSTHGDMVVAFAVYSNTWRVETTPLS